MGSQTNIDRKAAKVAAVREHLASSQMIFAANLEGLSVANVFQLKKRLPEGTTIMSVKNTLMRRAIEDSDWVGLGDFTKQSNMWFFVGEDIKNTVGEFEKFNNELKRDAGKKGGIFEGEIYDGSGIDAIAALPTKKELIAKIALLIKLVPTKLGRSVHLVPTKLARAIKLAFADDDSESSDAPAAE